MPGPKMGERPIDFDETIVKQAPTYQKWQTLLPGEKLKYACRYFTKGKLEDEERLLRRIMIARRNNLRDHELLKKARSTTKVRKQTTEEEEREKKKRRHDLECDVKGEMDEPAVEATRSYQAWLALEDGMEFVYNQKYVKGRQGHDFLLKKNIWRRMRYRRENKLMVEMMKTSKKQKEDATMGQRQDEDATATSHSTIQNNAEHHSNNPSSKAEEQEDQYSQQLEQASQIVDHALTPTTVTSATLPNLRPEHDTTITDHSHTAAAAAAAASANTPLVNKAVVEAAVRAAQSYVQTTIIPEPNSLSLTGVLPSDIQNPYPDLPNEMDFEHDPALTHGHVIAHQFGEGHHHHHHFEDIHTSSGNLNDNDSGTPVLPIEVKEEVVEVEGVANPLAATTSEENQHSEENSSSFISKVVTV